MVKKVEIFAGVILILFLFTNCSKDEPDFRNPFTGEFNFTTVSYTRSMCYDTSATCIDGWANYNYSTAHLTTEVEKYEKNKLKIHFGDGTIGNYNDSTYKEIIYPVLLPGGEFQLQDFPSGAHNYFKGGFRGNDTIQIDLHFGFLIGGYTVYKVTGVRVN